MLDTNVRFVMLATKIVFVLPRTHQRLVFLFYKSINPFFQGKLKEDSKKLINVLLRKKMPLKNNFLLPKNIC